VQHDARGLCVAHCCQERRGGDGVHLGDGVPKPPLVGLIRSDFLLALIEESVGFRRQACVRRRNHGRSFALLGGLAFLGGCGGFSLLRHEREGVNLARLNHQEQRDKRQQAH
jgi:hypothetical protein